MAKVPNTVFLVNSIIIIALAVNWIVLFSYVLWKTTRRYRSPPAAPLHGRATQPHLHEGKPARLSTVVVAPAAAHTTTELSVTVTPNGAGHAGGAAAHAPTNGHSPLLLSPPTGAARKSPRPTGAAVGLGGPTPRKHGAAEQFDYRTSISEPAPVEPRTFQFYTRRIGLVLSFFMLVRAIDVNHAFALWPLMFQALIYVCINASFCALAALWVGNVLYVCFVHCFLCSICPDRIAVVTICCWIGLFSRACFVPANA